MTTTSPYPTRVPRTRGPILAVIKGQTGLLHRCGHFVPGVLPTTKGIKAKAGIAMLDPLAPCPTCWPGGAKFHAQAMVLSVLTPQVPK